jgi:hypothetical protein
MEYGTPQRKNIFKRNWAATKDNFHREKLQCHIMYYRHVIQRFQETFKIQNEVRYLTDFET